MKTLTFLIQMLMEMCRSLTLPMVATLTSYVRVPTQVGVELDLIHANATHIPQIGDR